MRECCLPFLSFEKKNISVAHTPPRHTPLSLSRSHAQAKMENNGEKFKEKRRSAEFRWEKNK
jgi:hypothetical protein